MEDEILKGIFQNDISITHEGDNKKYCIQFNNKEYEFITDKEYPNSSCVTNFDLPKYVFDKYKNKPQIYFLLYECIKKSEEQCGLNTEFVSSGEYIEVETITHKQFAEFKLKNKKVKTKKAGLSGKEIFLLERSQKDEVVSGE